LILKGWINMVQPFSILSTLVPNTRVFLNDSSQEMNIPGNGNSKGWDVLKIWNSKPAFDQGIKN
jgi:hypothetical protein